MTNTRFVDLIRQFRDNAKRYQKSYALQVNLCLGLRLDEIEKSYFPDNEKQKRIEAAIQVVTNEYAPVDKSFKITPRG